MHILTIRDKKYRILSFRTKTELRASESQKTLVKGIGLWQISMAHALAHSGSLCLTPALTSSLLLSNFAYTVIARLAWPLLARSAAATLTHFIPVVATLMIMCEEGGVMMRCTWCLSILVHHRTIWRLWLISAMSMDDDDGEVTLMTIMSHCQDIRGECDA